MEERIIDDEYGRGIRMKKTKDGYVDVTDELAEETEGAEQAPETQDDEIAFEFPVLGTLEEDDEDLVGLSPEEALALKQKKAEEEAKRKADYERLCKEGEKLLEAGSYKAAELKYEKALLLDGPAVEATVGYWRAKTTDFSEPDELVGEYIKEGVEGMEYDLGYDAVDAIKRGYGEAFKRRIAELEKEEKPLAKEVEEKQASRREILGARLKNRTIAFAVSAVPMLVSLILALVFGMKNFSTPDAAYIVPTVVCACAFAVLFVVFAVFTNRFINACRIYRANERLSSTEEGEYLLELRAYRAVYESLSTPVTESVNTPQTKKTE